MKGLILLANNFEETEAIVTIDLLKRAGLFIDTVSMYETKEVTATYGIKILADKSINEVNLNDYEFLIIPGGSAVLEHLENEKTFKIVKHFEEKKQLIAAICAAPAILGKLGLLDKESYTCFPGFEKYSKGKYLEDHKVVLVNNHLTAKAMGAVFEFSYSIIEYLISTEKAMEVLSEVYYLKAELY